MSEQKHCGCAAVLRAIWVHDQGQLAGKIAQALLPLLCIQQFPSNPHSACTPGNKKTGGKG